MIGAPCSGEAASAHHIGADEISVTQSLLELELLVDAGVLAGAGVEELDELDELDEPESLLDDDVAGVDAADDELSDVAAFDDGLDPPRLSVL